MPVIEDNNLYALHYLSGKKSEPSLFPKFGNSPVLLFPIKVNIKSTDFNNLSFNYFFN